MSDGGKGSNPRPFSVSNEEYAKRWDAIFGRDKPDPRIVDDSQAEDEAFKLIEERNKFDKQVIMKPDYTEYDGPNRNTSNF